MTLEKQIYTEDDLRDLPKDGPRYEIVDGELVEMSPNGMQHVWVVGAVYRWLFEFVNKQRLGYVFTDNLIYVLHIDPETNKRRVRIPDVSFIRTGRLPKDHDFARPFYGAPDLAVEVMSPGDSASELLERVRDFFAYGTVQVWVLYPDQREIHQHINGQPQIQVYGADDTLMAEDLLPGLALPVGEMFVLPED